MPDANVDLRHGIECESTKLYPFIKCLSMGLAGDVPGGGVSLSLRGETRRA
jgi:hypothetical protein